MEKRWNRNRKSLKWVGKRDIAKEEVGRERDRVEIDTELGERNPLDDHGSIHPSTLSPRFVQIFFESGNVGLSTAGAPNIFRRGLFP